MSKYPTVYTGSFCIYFNREDSLILLIERGGTEGFGVPGGYVDIGDGKEQPREGAVRELSEEVLLPDGSPVLGAVTPQRLNLVDSGIDYSAAKPDVNHMGTVWHGHKCELTATEIKTLQAHIAKMNADSDYAEAVRKRSNGELKNVVLITPGDLQNGALSFRYPHEQAVVMAVAKQMGTDQKPQIQPHGFGC